MPRGKERGEKREKKEGKETVYTTATRKLRYGKIRALASAHRPQAAAGKESLAPGIREKNR
jgi:hypothetical protein